MEESEVKKQKKPRKRKHSKKELRETWAVLAILASVMLVALIITWFQSKDVNVIKISGEGTRQQREVSEKNRQVMYGAGIICVGIIAVYMVKRQKRNKKERQRLEQLYMEQQRLDRARSRVERARKMSMANDGRESISRGRGRKELIRNGDYDEESQVSRAEYMEQRRREYKYYMDNDLGDEEENRFDYLEDEVLDEETRSKPYRLIALLIGGIIIISIAATILFNVIT